MTRHPIRRGAARAVVLEYTDAIGDASIREVLPLAVLFGTGRRSAKTTYLQARCAARQAVRSFRFDRIRSVSDPTSGEVHDADEWVTTLPLDEGVPFTWDEAGENAAAPSPVERGSLRRWVAWRAALVAGVSGYAVGRLRLIPEILHIAGVHGARWL